MKNRIAVDSKAFASAAAGGAVMWCILGAGALLPKAVTCALKQR
jgi:hypothetical protein